MQIKRVTAQKYIQNPTDYDRVYIYHNGTLCEITQNKTHFIPLRMFTANVKELNSERLWAVTVYYGDFIYYAEKIS